MKCAIIGLPQAGKTSLFRILTGFVTQETHRHGEAEHIGAVSVPDNRLERLAKLFSSLKTTYPTLDYVDMPAIGKETLQETAFLAELRTMDALFHVVRVFADGSVPHIQGSVDPARDISDVDLELILSDLAVVENRLGKLEKDRKKIKNPDLEKEQVLLEKTQRWLESGKPLRDATWTLEEEKQLRSFAFLSGKPMLLVLNVGEEQAGQMDAVLQTTGLGLPSPRPHTLATVVSGKIEAELAIMPEGEAAEFRKSYQLTEPGRSRVVQATMQLLNLIVFLTVGEKESRSWMIPQGSSALQAADAIHSDLEKHFIRAEVVPWEKLLEAGSLAAARQRGSMRLEGKDYIVKDGDIMEIRHSG